MPTRRNAQAPSAARRPGLHSRLKFGPLLTGTLAVFWTAALSGLLLDVAPAQLLALHLTSAIGGMAIVAMFLRLHVYLRRDRVTSQPNAKWGFVALGALALLVVSGVGLVLWTNVPPLRWLHNGALVVLAADLTFHMAWRLRRRGWLTVTIRPELPRWLLPGVLGGVVVGIAVAAGVALTEPARAQPIGLVHGSLGSASLPAAGDCAACHQDIADGWHVSGHAAAATDPYYLGLTALFARERGIAAVEYCAACHNPVGLMQGEVDPKAVVRSSGAAYEDRNTGVTLALSDRAAEGVTCAVCHQTLAAQPVNGGLQIVNAAGLLPTAPLAQLGLRAAPAAHRNAMLRPVVQEAALCGACHNLSLPNGMKLEPTFDEWRASSYPAEGKTCQSCHLPEALGRRVTSGLVGQILSHGGVPGAPSSLPGVASSADLLKEAAQLDVHLEQRDGEFLAIVGVTNSGTGHYLPSGADDLRQVWLEVTLRDRAGQVVWQSGALDQYGGLDPTTVRFGKVLGDSSGRPIALHRFWATASILQDTRIAPIERREVRYHLPSEAGGSLTVRLLYQDVSRAFAEVTLNRRVDNMPVREMASMTETTGR